MKKYKFIIIGVVIGALAGYAYYYFIGCASGTCAITSKPLNSTLYGSFLGGLLGDSVKNIVNRKTKLEEDAK